MSEAKIATDSDVYRALTLLAQGRQPSHELFRAICARALWSTDRAKALSEAAAMCESYWWLFEEGDKTALLKCAAAIIELNTPPRGTGVES